MKKTKVSKGTILGVTVLSTAAQVLGLKQKKQQGAKLKSLLNKMTKEKLETQIEQGTACSKCTYRVRNWNQIISHMEKQCKVISAAEAKMMMEMHDQLKSGDAKQAGKAKTWAQWDTDKLKVGGAIVDQVREHVRDLVEEKIKKKKK